MKLVLPSSRARTDRTATDAALPDGFAAAAHLRKANFGLTNAASALRLAEIVVARP